MYDLQIRKPDRPRVSQGERSVKKSTPGRIDMIFIPFRGALSVYSVNSLEVWSKLPELGFEPV